MRALENYKEKGEYIIYRDARVFSKRKGIFLVPSLGTKKSKYYTVKVPNRVKLHRLVAEMFIPNPNNLPEVNHLDGDKLNNNAWNLEWCTKAENMNHAYANGLIKRTGRPKISPIDVKIIREAINIGFNNKQIASYYKLDPHQIYCIKTGRSWASR